MSSSKKPSLKKKGSNQTDINTQSNLNVKLVEAISLHEADMLDAMSSSKTIPSAKDKCIPINLSQQVPKSPEGINNHAPAKEKNINVEKEYHTPNSTLRARGSLHGITTGGLDKLKTHLYSTEQTDAIVRSSSKSKASSSDFQNQQQTPNQSDFNNQPKLVMAAAFLRADTLDAASSCKTLLSTNETNPANVLSPNHMLDKISSGNLSAHVSSSPESLNSDDPAKEQNIRMENEYQTPNRSLKAAGSFQAIIAGDLEKLNLQLYGAEQTPATVLRNSTGSQFAVQNQNQSPDGKWHDTKPPDLNVFESHKAPKSVKQQDSISQEHTTVFDIAQQHNTNMHEIATDKADLQPRKPDKGVLSVTNPLGQKETNLTGTSETCSILGQQPVSQPINKGGTITIELQIDRADQNKIQQLYGTCGSQDLTRIYEESQFSNLGILLSSKKFKKAD